MKSKSTIVNACLKLGFRLGRWHSEGLKLRHIKNHIDKLSHSANRMLGGGLYHQLKQAIYDAFDTGAGYNNKVISEQEARERYRSLHEKIMGQIKNIKP